MKDKKVKMNKLYYVVLSAGAALLAIATVLTVYFVLGGGNFESGDKTIQAPVDTPVDKKEEEGPTGGNEKPDVPTGGEQTPDEPTVEEKPEYVSPLDTTSVLNDYGFYCNTTLGWYYEHTGIDLASTVGASVYAMADGKVAEIKKDELTGEEITIDYGNGVSSTYRFIDVDGGIKVGDTVTQGQKVGTVAEPTGNEYKDGAHVHLEIVKGGKTVDPVAFLSLDEK